MAGGYQTWPLIQFSVIGEAWRLYKRHWVVWSLAMLIVMTGYSVVAGGCSLFWTTTTSRARRLSGVSALREGMSCNSWFQRSSAASSWAE